ncbi:hypothetical protein HMPREF1556_00353 [Porphyromonas sp. oral taxon 278 str. W7784]|nr:hypothetical protein HMPREF1556_00353 [Porphyromonas sp. oral taxon 278 str. W7784]
MSAPSYSGASRAYVLYQGEYPYPPLTAEPSASSGRTMYKEDED